MSNIKTIKEKINSVANLKKITKAMEMVAISKMKRATDAALATRMYATYALELLVNLSKGGHNRNPYLFEPAGDRVLVLHIASNKGLCGGYNMAILRSSSKYFSNKEQKLDFITVGRYAYRHAVKLEGDVIARFDDFSDNPAVDEVAQLSDLVLEKFSSGDYKTAFIVYTNFISIFSQEVIVRKFLPVSKESLKNILSELGEDSSVETASDLASGLGRKSLYIYEPDEEEILDFVVPRLIKMQIYQSLLEARASEHSARMVAMKSASDSADKIGEELLLIYNKARQERITKEILEIVSGAEALSES